MVRKFRDRPIRWKLIWLTVLASGVALALLLTAFVTYQRLSYPARLARELTAQAEIVGRNSAAAVVFNDPAAADTTLRALEVQRSIREAAIYRASGERFARYARAEAASGLPERWLPGEPEYPTGSDVLSLDAPIVLDGERIGSVVILADLSEMHTLVWRSVGLAILLLGISLGIAVLASARLLGTISAPILELAETARIVSEQRDYRVRARVTSNDEIGFLIRTFNEMLTRIEVHERELEKARDSALEASRLKSSFLANMSHEIRTPLNIILGYAELFEDAVFPSGGPQPQEIFEAIRRASGRLTDTIAKILDISKIETGAFEIERVPITIATVVDRCLAEVRILAQRRGLELTCRLDEPGAVVMFDEYCVSQALLNLLSNAIKFTDKGGVHIRLARDDDGCLALSVTDTGVGIRPAYLLRLFEPFSQEDGGVTRRFEGSGLGLALVRHYLEVNGARPRVTSEKDRGSTFSIQFSRESEDEAACALLDRICEPAPLPLAAPVRPVENKDMAPVAPPSRRPTVLLLEDDVDTQAFMRSVLEKHVQLLVASTVPEAQRELNTHASEVRVILVDVALKDDVDGLSFARQLRQDAAWCDVPIIATTAFAFAEDRAKAFAAGCDAFLAKPISRHTLLETIAQQLELVARRPDTLSSGAAPS